MKAIGEACGINLPKLKSKLNELGEDIIFFIKYN